MSARYGNSTGRTSRSVVRCPTTSTSRGIARPDMPRVALGEINRCVESGACVKPCRAAPAHGRHGTVHDDSKLLTDSPFLLFEPSRAASGGRIAVFLRVVLTFSARCLQPIGRCALLVGVGRNTPDVIELMVGDELAEFGHVSVRLPGKPTMNVDPRKRRPAPAP